MIPIKTTQNYRQTSVKLLVVLVMLLTCSDIVAQVKTSFTPRYNETVNGDVTIIANNMLSRSATGNYTGSDGNHDFTDNVYVDIDSDNSTFNSSNANFVNPEPTLSCLTIKKVLLYWAAADKEPNSNLNSENQANWNYNDVKLMLPGQTLYSTLTADDVIFRGRDETSHFSNDPYICVKDITTAVTNLTNPYGTYQVANVEAKTGSVEAHPSGNTGTSGGWQIVFVYESPMMPAKNIALFDGYAHVTSSENDFDIDFNGFQTVPTGNVNAKIVIGALEGDRDLSGDKLQIQNTSGNFVDISSSQRSSTNFFNSRITVDGANYTNRIPASTNTLGFDAATFHLSNPSNSIIDNDQTSATIRLTSNQETYGLFLVGLAVDVWLPDLAPITLVPTPPSTIAQDPGSTMSFGFDIENNGNDNAINVQVTSTIAPEVDLVEPITGLPTGITYTYNSSTKILTFFIANGLADVGDPPLSVNYQIIVKDECYFLEGSCSSNFSSQFTATYNGVLNPNLQTTVTSSSVDNCGIGDELPTIMQINQPNEATWLTALGSLDRTVECNDLTGLADAQSLAPIASCPNLIPIKTAGSFITDPNCNDNGSYTNTWNFTDACGRTIANFVQVITIQDSTPPTFTAPADIEIFTDASCNYDAGVNITGDVTDEADNCSTTLDATYTDTVVAGTCEGSFVITRTWTLTDSCGNTAPEQTQTITVSDNIAPTFTAPADIEIFTDASCNYDAGVNITGDVTDEADNCSATLDATYTNTIVAGTCEGSFIITRTWTLTDSCGNTAPEQTQTITVSDNIAPTFTAPADIEIFTDASCNYDAGVNITGDVTDEADNCSSTLDATYTDTVVAGTCEGSFIITRTWTLTDSCGNTAPEQTQTITVSDNIAPTFTAPADIEIFTDASCNYDAGVNITGDVTDEADNCSATLDATYTDTIVAGTCEGSFVITRTWTLTDSCGNTAPEQTQTITVSDNIAPTFTAPADIEIFTDASCNYDAGVNITGDVTDEADNCSATLDATYTDTVVAGTCEGSFIITRTWTLTDSCGNTAPEQTQTITVSDNIAPTFTAPADIEIFTDASCNYDAGVNITGDVTDEADNCSTTLDATYTDTVVAGTCEGSFVITRTWTLTDSCGNTAPEQTQTITVSDNIAPTFTAPADIEIFTDASCNYDAGVNITGDVTDENDNCSTTLDATYTDAVVAGTCEGSFVITRTWTLTDSCGNTAPEQTQTITVSDNIAPTFTAPADIEIFTDASCNYDAGVNITGDVTDEADNCSSTLDATYTDTVVAGTCEGSFIITRTWTLTDSCGNTAPEQIQTITVSDNIAPTFTAPADIEIFTDASCNYDAGVNITGDVTDEADNCSATLDATYTDTIVAGTCEGSFVITRTWTLTDSCGNTAPEQTQTITVSDNIAPTFTAPADIEIFTDASCNYDAGVNITGDVTDEADNCSATLDATYTDTVVAGTCEGTFVITRTWTLTDSCGNTAPEQTQTITVSDNIAPTFTAPADIEIFTDASCNYDAGVNITGDVTDEADNCSTTLDATYTDTIVAGTCEGSFIITRTWTLTDSCGNTAPEQTQTITVSDNIAPTFTAPADIEIECDQDPNDLTITGDVTDENDNCSTTLDATYTDTTASGSCANESVITRTWTLADDCGNTTTLIQTITISDNTAPDISSCNITNQSVDCTATDNQTIADQWNADNIAALQACSTDNCDTDLTNQVTSDYDFNNLNTVCGPCGTITVNYTVTDDCGNSSSIAVTLTFGDATGPDLSSCTVTDEIIECDATNNETNANQWNTDNIAAIEACANDISVVVTSNYDYNNLVSTCGLGGTIPVIYTATDACGNVTNLNATLTIQDSTPPTFTAPADIEIFTDASCNYDAGVNITGDVTDEADNCSSTLDATYTDTIVAGTCEGSFIITRTWTLTDSCGNTAPEQTQTITVSDNIAPTFTAPADIEIFTDASCNYDAGVNITGDVTDEADNCSTTLDATYTDAVVAGTCEGSFVITRTWTLTDSCGNTAPEQTQTITVSDNIAPTFTAPADIEIFTDASCNYDAGVNITGDVTDEADNCSSTLDATYTDTVVAGTCEGSFIITRTWTLTDSCGNTAPEQTQTITVSDNIAPTFTAPADIEIFTDASCNYDAGVNITGDVTDEADNCSATLDATYTDTVVAGTCEGSFIITRTWTLTDSCGNTAPEQTQTITVSDNIAPTFTAPADIEIFTDASCNYDAGVNITGNVTDEADNCSATLDATYTDTVVAGTCEGSFIITRTWTLTDSCGNTAPEQTQTITVSDNIAPTFTAPADIEIFTDASCNYDAGVNITGDVTDEADNCSATLGATYTDTVVAGTCEGSFIITRTWTLTDSCGNTAPEQTQTITVSDNIAPTFTAPVDIEIFTDASCNYDAGVNITGDVTDEADNCSTTLDATYTDAVVAGTCEGSFIITRTWTLTDSCGNTAPEQTQTITVSDNIAPTFTAPADIEIFTDASCNYDAGVNITGDVTDEADNCSATLDATYTDTIVAGTCEGSFVITRTWTLTDSCGNTAPEQTQTITVSDNIAPTFTAPADIEIFTDASCNYDAGVNITGDVTDENDNCSATLDATYTDTVVAGTCEGSFIITRTWTLTDSCGNTAPEQTQTITVSDNIAPTFTAPADIEIFTDASCNYDAGVNITGDVTDEADNCSATLDATYTDTVVAGTCEGSFIITRTWTLTDSCGNTAPEQTQTITVSDNIAPTFTAPVDIEIFTDASCNYDAGVNITGDVTDEADNCSTTLDATYTDAVVAGTCEGSFIITRTWTLTDSCGNTAPEQTQTITVSDNIAPTFTAPADIEIFTDASCNYDAGVNITGDVTDENDNCSATLDATYTDTVVAGTCEGSFTITRTWTLTDSCGNTAPEQTQTITVSDNIAPTFTAPADIEIECDQDPNDLTITGNVTDENDNCSTTLDATYTDTTASGSCANESVITRTWTLADDCGNTTTLIQTITVSDNTAPDISSCNITNQSVDCTATDNQTIADQWNADNIAALQACSTDNCDTDLTNQVTSDYDFNNLNTVCGPCGTITVNYTVTDDCGNSSSIAVTLTFGDATGPDLSSCTVTDEIIECDATNNETNANQWNTDNIAAIEACANDISVVVTSNYDYNNLVSTCGLGGTIPVIYTATDACGNVTNLNATLTIQDSTPPTFTAPADIEIFTDASCNYDAGVNITGDVTDENDNCSATLDATYTDAVVAGTCEGSFIITRTWTLTDSCGNTAPEQTQTITVSDNIAPTFTAPADIEIFTDTSCNYDAGVNITGDVTDENDNCSATLDATYTDTVVAGTCEGSFVITRTWTLTDSCGNTAPEQTQTITVSDNIAPTFTAPADIEIFTDASCNYDAGVNITGDVTDEADNCSTTLDATYTDAVVAGTCEGSFVITRTWTLTDSCGNTAPEQTQTITVSDNIAPTFTAPADIEIFTDASCNYDAGVNITGDVTDEADNCSTTLDATYTDTVVAGTCEGSFIITRTWTLTDSCGNTAPEQTQTITVSDNIAPTFTAPADIEIFTDASCNYDAGVNITGDVTDEADNCSSTLDATYTDAVVAGTCEGSFVITRTWTLTDSCGNTAPEQTQTITVSDNIAPTFTAPADIEIFTDASCNYDAGVNITGDVTDEADNCSTTLDATYTDTVVAGTCEGSFIITRTWTLTDSCGNTSPEQTQTITVSDNIAPTFTAPADIEIFTDASCNYDAGVNITGDVTDEADNCSATLDATYTDAVVAGTCEGSFIITRTWTLTDSCGNTAPEQTQTITVSDNIVPTFTAPADIEIFTDASCNYDAGVNITGDVTDEADNCSTTLDATYTDTVVAGTCEGSFVITRTWTLTDSCGNTAPEQTQTITVSDNIAPTFTAPADIEIECDQDPNDLTITGDVTDENDNCSTTLDATYTDTTTSGSCANESVITRTWTLADDCGNTTTLIQTITVSDNTAPTFTVPTDIEIECDQDASDLTLTGDVTDEADNCSTNLDATYTDTTQAGDCPNESIITRTWTLSDDCGNNTELVQTITVSDNTAPTLTTDLEPIISVTCSEIPEIPSLEFIDACSGTDITISFEETSTYTGDGNDYEITWEWTVTDSCDNTEVYTQIVQVNNETFTTELDDERCNEDGAIDLFNYLSDDIDTSGTWEVVSGDTIIDNGIFEPLDVELGDYVFSYTITDGTCLTSTIVTITINDDCVVLPCGSEDFEISKAITPNGDAYNEYFEVKGTRDCGFTVELKLFNRWGAIIYESNDYQNDWNGFTHKSSLGNSNKVPNGTYYYVVTIKDSGIKPFAGPIYVGTK